MNDPRRASLRLLALLTLTALAAAALPRERASAQSAPAQQPPSPNGKIVFQSTQGGDGFMSDIYVMDADGKHQTRLTDSPAIDDASPIWSPNGDQIAFLSDRGGNGYEIYLMNPDGSNQRPLRTAANGGPINGANIEWSPDGKRLKYETSGFDLGDIYVVEVVAAGGVGDSITPPQKINANRPAGAEDTDAHWSPDGARFVFRSIACDFCLLTELYTMNADGTNRVPVTNDAGVESAPRWSPDGTRVVYTAERNGVEGIYVKNANGAGAEVKVSGDAATPSGAVWSPDGTRVAFVGYPGRLYTAAPDGSALTLLVDGLANGGGDIFWSPDGLKLAFHNNTANCVDLYVVNADGSRRPTNYTKTRRDDEFASTWQKIG